MGVPVSAMGYAWGEAVVGRAERGGSFFLTALFAGATGPSMRRRLPVGKQDFATLRERGYCYVDKTAILHQLVDGDSEACFLSRPRRFGKT